MAASDTQPDADEIQLAIYRRMTPQARLQAALELTRISRELIAQGIRARHPAYSDEQVKLALIRVWLGPDLFRTAYPLAPALEP